MTEATMKITAIAPWFGAKRTLASRIVEEIGPHRIYWEPMCGSMAVLLAKSPCAMETVSDLHGDLINLARVIRDPVCGPQFYRRLRRTLMAEEIFNESREVIIGAEAGDTMDLDRAYHFFVVSWLGRSGVIGTNSYNLGFCVRYTANGGHAAKRWDSAIQSIPAWRKRLRNVTILRRNVFELLPRIDDAPDTAIYMDPPYLAKGAAYLHNFDAVDGDAKRKKISLHVRLAAELRRFKHARVVVSYYEHERLKELYDGWTKREIPITKSLVNQGMRDQGGAVKAPEILLLNGPGYAKAKERTLF